MTYKILTFNLRTFVESDGINKFSNRIDAIINIILKNNPDIIGFQEVKTNMLELLSPLFPEYEFCGEYRENCESKEANFIFYKKEFQKIESKTLWLSPTPKISESRFIEDQSHCPRIFTHLKLKINNKIFNIINTHLDHEGKLARLKASELLLQYVKNLDITFPLIISGDFNDTPNSKPILNMKSLLKDQTSEITHSFHGFGKIKNDFKIDYIFTNNKIIKKKSYILKNEFDNNYLSDHHPILLEFEVK